MSIRKSRVNKIVKGVGDAYMKHKDALLKMKTCPSCQFESLEDGGCKNCGYFIPLNMKYIEIKESLVLDKLIWDGLALEEKVEAIRDYLLIQRHKV